MRKGWGVRLAVRAFGRYMDAVSRIDDRVSRHWRVAAAKAMDVIASALEGGADPLDVAKACRVGSAAFRNPARGPYRAANTAKREVEKLH